MAFAPKGSITEVSFMFSCEFLAASEPLNQPTKTQCSRLDPDTLPQPHPNYASINMSWPRPPIVEHN